MIWAAGQYPEAPNSEIVRLTGVSTDTLTIIRTQESTSARSVIVGDLIAAAWTAKALQDIEALLLREGDVKRKTANYTITLSDKTIVCNCAAGAVTLSLPAVATAIGYSAFRAVKEYADLSLNAVILDPNGSELINGQSTFSFTGNGEAFDFMPDGNGTGWMLV